MVLVAVGVTGNVEGLAAPEAKLEIVKSRVKVDPTTRRTSKTSGPSATACRMHWPEQAAMGGYRHPDLAHVAHHEAVYLRRAHLRRIRSHDRLRNIPGCTYTHPQVASMGHTEKKAREQKREIKIGKFPSAPAAAPWPRARPTASSS